MAALSRLDDTRGPSPDVVAAGELVGAALVDGDVVAVVGLVDGSVRCIRDRAQVDVDVVLEGRVPEGEEALAPGEPSSVTSATPQAAELRGQAAWSAHGGGREDEGGVRAECV